MPNKKAILILLIPWILNYIFKDDFALFFTISICNLPQDGQLAKTVFFFISTVLKIFLLLILIIFLSGMIRSFFSPEKTRKALEGKSLFAGNILASLLGIVTPFCSCSAIPLFLGFIEAGIPIGVTFSFLIAAPLINEVAVVMLFIMFGWKTGLIYIFTGLIIAIISGWIIGRLKLEKWVHDWVLKAKFGNQSGQEEKLSFNNRVWVGLQAVKDIVAKIWLYVILGIAIGSIIHGYVPEDYLVSLMNKTTWYSVPLSILIGIPLYSCSAGAVPIAAALIEKGVPLGTALAFMMSVIGISLPELIILEKVLKVQFLLVFVGILAGGIMIVGYLFNLIF